jgi:CII-binding regulator of phage lambda lysogenization HflD
MTTETHARNIAVQEQLKNEAIDNAFKEIHEDVQLIFATLDAHNRTLTAILEILDDQRELSEKTDKLSGEIMELQTRNFQQTEISDALTNRIRTLEKHVEFLEIRTHHLINERRD